MISNDVIRKIFILLLIIIDILMFKIIFYFSSQNGEESTKISRGITENITSNIKTIKEETNEIEKENKIFFIEILLRKFAHFLLYTIIGMITMLIFVLVANIKDNHKILYTLLIGIFYAITDEIHQLFVAERAAKIMDIVIDSIGIFFGIYIVFILYKLNKCKKISINCKLKSK